MKITVKWTKAADGIGIGQPRYVSDIFDVMTGNDGFDAMLSATGIEIVGDTRLEGLNVTLKLKINGEGLTYTPDGDLVGGTVTGFNLFQITDVGEEALLRVRDWNVDGAALNDAVALDDGGFGGDSRALDTILYGPGWNYFGVNSVNVITLDDGFTFDGDAVLFNGNDTFRLGRSDDTLDAQGGSDKVFAGGGNDTIRGGAGRDKLFGGRGDDDLTGDEGFFGGARDVLNGGAGNDTLYGAGRGDRLIGGRGSDLMDGGQGGDTYVFNDNSGHDFIFFERVGRDKLEFNTDETLMVEAVVVEETFESGPFEGQFFDRGYIITWGDNSVMVNTYANLDRLGLDDFVLV